MGAYNSELRIKLTQLEIARTNLRIEAKGLCHSIQALIVPALNEIEEMDVAKAAGYMDDLVMKQSELLGLQTKIWEIEEALR